MRTALLQLLALALASSALASDSVRVTKDSDTGRYAVTITFTGRGIGQSSCGSFVIADKEPSNPEMSVTIDDKKTYLSVSRAYREWANGYLSHHNYQRTIAGKPEITVDNAGAMLWLRNWCERHPTMIFAQAVQTLADES